MAPTFSKKMLLVEDDSILLEMYQKKFENEGFIVYLAHNGEEGLKSALDTHPDLILLDLKMPKMDGLTMMDFLRKISTTPSDVVKKTKEIIGLFA